MSTEHTRVIRKEGRVSSIEFLRCTLRVVAGPDLGKEAPVETSLVRMGTSPACTLVLTDTAVSRNHCELAVDERGFILRDLGSTNGVFVNGLQAFEIALEPKTKFTIGATEVELVPEGDRDRVEIRLSAADHFGRVAGKSVKMREIFFLLERMAAKDVTVLLAGETGTGKEVVARSIHEASPRRSGPFIVVDCGSLPGNLVEAELFGNARGAFTGAVSDRPGAFEDANGGTIFLDEVGELPLEQQVKLLRVLETHEIKRLGENQSRRVDVRVIAATNRTLADEVESGAFRRDLFFRLSVAEIRIPPLRERREDIPLLAAQILEKMRPVTASKPPSLSAGAIAALQEHAWPGNVRELRNVLEKAVTLADGQVLDTGSVALGSVRNQLPSGQSIIDPSLPYETAHDLFEREYLMAVLKANEMNVSAAARAAGIHRQTIHRLLRKHGIKMAELRD